MASSPFSLDERRRRRDERLAVQQADQIVQEAATRGRTITLEWAAVAVLLAAGVAATAAVWYRHMDSAPLGAALWAGFVLGALLANASLQAQRSRLPFLALALFTGVPLAGIPLHWFAPAATTWPLWAAAALGAAAFGGGLRWAADLRVTLGELRDNANRAGEALAKTAAAAGAWFHDALIKWLVALLMVAIGAGLVYFGRQQQRETFVWAGLVLIFLIGSVGLWAPGLYRRTRPAVALRHCGQLCFWISFLIAPLLELAPAGTAPYVARPSIRFAVMGAGLIVIGGAWFLQRISIFSHHSVPEAKHGTEKVVAMAIAILGLALTLAGLEAHMRMKLSADQNTIADTNIAGSVRFEPTAQLRSLVIVQPLERVPLYLEYLQFDGGTTYLEIPLLYPGQQLQPDQHGLVQAIRAAGSLNKQSFPEARVEQWTH